MCCILIDNKMLNISFVAFRFRLKNMEGEKDVIFAFSRACDKEKSPTPLLGSALPTCLFKILGF